MRRSPGVSQSCPSMRQGFGAWFYLRAGPSCEMLLDAVSFLALLFNHRSFQKPAVSPGVLMALVCHGHGKLARTIPRTHFCLFIVSRASPGDPENHPTPARPIFFLFFFSGGGGIFRRAADHGVSGEDEPDSEKRPFAARRKTEAKDGSV